MYQTALLPFAPNPLVGGATGKIRFTMAEEARATVEVFDLNGRLVRTVFSGMAQRGPNEVTWGGHDQAGRAVASGVYFIRLKTPDRSLRTKLVLIGNDRR
jgi:flagellar hook assembly protein FlgD